MDCNDKSWVDSKIHRASSLLAAKEKSYLSSDEVLDLKKFCKEDVTARIACIRRRKPSLSATISSVAGYI
jgi:hypothetical protein